MIERPIYARVCKNREEAKGAYSLLGRMPFEDWHFPIEITVERWHAKRTDQQNRYLWGVVYAIICSETGNEANDIHDYMLGEFFGWEEYEVLGKKKVRPRERSSKQIKARFSEYLEFVISRAAFLGIVIPPPNHDLPAQ